MNDDRIEFGEYSLHSALGQVGYINTNQRKLVEAAILIRQREVGRLGPREVSDILSALESGHLITSSQHANILKKLFAE